MMRIFLPTLVAIWAVHAFAFVTPPYPVFLQASPTVLRTASQGATLDQHLMDLAQKFKLEIFDLDEGLFGFDSKDNRYGLEVVHTNIDVGNDGLGLVLTEMAGSPDGRGLVMVSKITGNAAKANPQAIHVGDTITGVMANDGVLKERVTAFNYDKTVEAIGRAKESSTDGTITLELNRLIKRLPVRVEIDDGSGHVQVIEALAGENLRRMFMRKQLKLYDERTRRFDQPFNTGNCGGDGVCGTCLVNVLQGMDLLNPKDSHEVFITKGRPPSWRASCRTTVGFNNVGGTLRISLHPQSELPEELSPGVKSLKP
ncbi:predicted protein [Phaeodactylum tricornutum CCAP 1055/1]|uniref:PDZ domain-containing protein n=2 Tax=Phaeodactylum tricornutum TaxID=2850 RepID=B7G5I1_PHATC|nr:predicted protein [Phaeodactylum tricornutum CCAP 1055/1]EEC46319.1 predicted protein [Phaeodactylum tricornutum CCAP 1055/1]|eukprot:XP_002182418.1 predicted protein [Phaeodactylum tricornutum CCAP 1055/1]